MTRRASLLLPILALASLLPAAGSAAVEPVASHRTDDPLTALGVAVTAGAAPGYVDDGTCALCHADLAASYQSVSMSHAFYAPGDRPPIEDFSTLPFYHPPSRRWFDLRWEDGTLRFSRWLEDSDGERVSLFETPVAWILGSGERSRTYLFRTPDGSLFQLPLAWYSQEGAWGMAPGFDDPRHEDIYRLVRRECMFCHNSYPQVAAGTDTHWQPHAYPEQLPAGLGCQRCHGPGAEHVELASRSEVDPAAARRSLVDLSAVPAERRNDVCLQCHLQASVALFGIRRFDRGDYSYRPGEPLEDYVIHLDPSEEDLPREERFEINHHPYRLFQSRCAELDGRPLGCVTCHDPHRKPTEAGRIQHYRQACASCHPAGSCSRAAAGAPAAGDRDVGWRQRSAADDCASCHMPKRRPQDVVHVVVTDHRIVRDPGDADLLAPLTERRPKLAGARFLAPGRAPTGDLGLIYISTAWQRAGLEAGGARLFARLREQDPGSLEPFFDLAKSLLETGRPDATLKLIGRLEERGADDDILQSWRAVALAQTGDTSTAIELLEELTARHPGEGAENLTNLGRLLLADERPLDAIVPLERATHLRPNLLRSWISLATAYRQAGRLEDARQAADRGLALEPEAAELYTLLADVLVALGHDEEALRRLRHGERFAEPPGAVVARIREIEASTGAIDGGQP